MDSLPNETLARILWIASQANLVRSERPASPKIDIIEEAKGLFNVCHRWDDVLSSHPAFKCILLALLPTEESFTSFDNFLQSSPSYDLDIFMDLTTDKALSNKALLAFMARAIGATAEYASRLHSLDVTVFSSRKVKMAFGYLHVLSSPRLRNFSFRASPDRYPSFLPHILIPGEGHLGTSGLKSLRLFGAKLSNLQTNRFPELEELQIEDNTKPKRIGFHYSEFQDLMHACPKLEFLTLNCDIDFGPPLVKHVYMSEGSWADQHEDEEDDFLYMEHEDLLILDDDDDDDSDESDDSDSESELDYREDPDVSSATMQGRLTDRELEKRTKMSISRLRHKLEALTSSDPPTLHNLSRIRIAELEACDLVELFDLIIAPNAKELELLSMHCSGTKTMEFPPWTRSIEKLDICNFSFSTGGAKNDFTTSFFESFTGVTRLSFRGTCSEQLLKGLRSPTAVPSLSFLCWAWGAMKVVQSVTSARHADGIPIETLLLCNTELTPGAGARELEDVIRQVGRLSYGMARFKEGRTPNGPYYEPQSDDLFIAHFPKSPIDSFDAATHLAIQELLQKHNAGFTREALVAA